MNEKELHECVRKLLYKKTKLVIDQLEDVEPEKIIRKVMRLLYMALHENFAPLIAEHGNAKDSILSIYMICMVGSLADCKSSDPELIKARVIHDLENIVDQVMHCAEKVMENDEQNQS